MNVIIFGATSAIAHAAARRFASEKAVFYLVARDAAKLAAIANDLAAHGASDVTTDAVDLSDLDGLAPLVERITKVMPRIDVAILAQGILGEQALLQKDMAAVQDLFRINFLSYVGILTPLAQHLEEQRAGVIAIVSSVAGDRGRQSNYVYGSSKAALTAFAGGLRQRLCRAGVHVVTIKPGFISTPMTAHLRQGPLYASAAVAGEGIYRAIVRRCNVAYVPSFWRFIMLVIKTIPEGLFKRLRL